MIQMYLSQIKSINDTSEWTQDEIYVIVVAVDTTSFPPTVAAVSYGPVSISKGNTHIYDGRNSVTVGGGNLSSPGSRAIKPFWGVTGSFKNLTNPNNAIFIATVMENDDGDVGAKREMIKLAAIASSANSLNATREVKVNSLLNDIADISGTPTGAPNFDDKVGRPKELKFSTNDLKKAKLFFGQRKKLNFKGDGGEFELTFQTRTKTRLASLENGIHIRQVSSGRLLDAYQTEPKDFSAVTRNAQENDTQKWIISGKTGAFTIQQKSSGRYLDAHQKKPQDFSAVTRKDNTNNSKKWIIKHVGSDKYTIQQKSSGRFLDAHQTVEKDFSVVTRTEQNNETQLWTFSID